MHRHPLRLLLLAAAIAGTGAAEELVIPPPGASPFAERPADSYSSFTADDGKPGALIWGKAPVNDFGSRTVVMDIHGARTLHQVPAAGVHPRILFTPADLPDLRKRLKETRCGQEAWKNLLCWTEMLKGTYDEHADYAQPDRWNGGFGGLHGRVPLFRLGMTRPYQHNTSHMYDDLAAGTATAFPEYAWNVFALEAFRCLVEDDEAGGRKLAKAVITALAIDQTERAAALAKKPSARPPAEPVGRFQLAFTYDFIHRWLDATQRAAIHDELAATSWSHDNYGTFNEATTSRSNWATFSYWLFEALAIEGEPGFNDLKVRGMYRGWRNLLTYGWFQSGATFEGEAKSQLGLDGVIPFAMRAQAYGFDNLVGHPYLRAYATRFLPHSILPTRDGFIKYDLLGGSRTRSGGFTPCDLLGLKYLLPEDPVVDWVYRKTVGEQYENVPDRPDGYYNGLLFFAIFATDFTPANDDPSRLGLGNTFQCGERALMMTRSDWSSPDATMVCLHTRQANGGHPFADRNGLMLTGAGRVWSPNGYASFSTAENSVVGIDGKQQGEWVAGRMVEIQDRPQATFAVGDAAYAWNWNWQYLAKKRGYYTVEDVRTGMVEVPAGWQLEPNSVNDLALTKLPFPYLNVPMSEKPHWIQPAGAISPLARQANYPVLRAFRSAGLIRGARPYVLVVDDIQKDQAVHRYDWTLALEYDLQIARIDRSRAGQLDLLLTGDDPTQQRTRAKDPLPPALAESVVIPAGQPVLLVRVLQCDTATERGLEPTIVELPNAKDPAKYGTVRRLIVPATSVAPRFKVLLYPYRQGAPLPATTWNGDHTAVTVAWPEQEDVVAFSPGTSGVTHVAVTRAGTNLISLAGEATPLK